MRKTLYIRLATTFSILVCLVQIYKNSIIASDLHFDRRLFCLCNRASDPLSSSADQGSMSRSMRAPMATPANASYSIYQAREYILGVISALRIGLQASITHKNLDLLTNYLLSVIDELHYQTDKDLIDQLLRGAIIEFVEKIAFTTAYEQTGNNLFAEKLAESMRNNVMALMSKQRYISASLISPFVGIELQKAIDNFLIEQAGHYYFRDNS